MNESQNVMVSSSQYNIIYVDISNSTEEANEVSISKQNNVSLVKAIIYDEEAQSFYIMTNMFNEQQGFYLFNVKIADP